MNKMRPLKVLAIIFLFSFSAAAQTTLDDQVKPIVASFKGKVSLFAKNLDTGETYGLNPDERVRTASTIKIAVMIEAFARVAEGKAKWTDEVVLTKEKKVSGSGILSELSDGLKLTLRDAVNLMMILSDNTATNLVLDVLTTDAVNARMESLGFKQIKIMRKVGSGGESGEQEIRTGHGDAARMGARDGEARAWRSDQFCCVERNDRPDETRTGSKRDRAVTVERTDGEQIRRTRSAA